MANQIPVNLRQGKIITILGNNLVKGPRAKVINKKMKAVSAKALQRRTSEGNWGLER
jgi:hypothetical protein